MAQDKGITNVITYNLNLNDEKYYAHNDFRRVFCYREVKNQDYDEGMNAFSITLIMEYDYTNNVWTV